MRPHSILLLFSALFAAADSVNPCDRSLIKDVTAEEITYDGTTKTLTCKDGSNSLMAIEFGSSLYKSLTCDEVKGWKDGHTYPYDSNKLRREGIANASEPISVKCVEYCAVDGPVISDLHKGVLKNTTITTRMIGCEDSRRVFFNSKQMIGLQCSFEHYGWISIAVDTPLTTPLKVECRLGCTQGCRTDIIKSLADENESKTVFKCNKGEVNGTMHGVSVNGTVYPNLECDFKDGYTYGHNHAVADAFDVVDMQCDILPEPTTTTAEPEPPAPSPPGPKTPTNEEHTSDDEDTNKAMVIIGCMGAALVIVIILIVIMCIKRRRDEEEERQREEKRQKKREQRKKEERRREEESRTETEDVSEEV